MLGEARENRLKFREIHRNSVPKEGKRPRKLIVSMPGLAHSVSTAPVTSPILIKVVLTGLENLCSKATIEYGICPHFTSKGRNHHFYEHSNDYTCTSITK